MSNGWSNLPMDLLRSIEGELFSYFDKLQFSYVCKTWHEASNLDPDGLPFLVVPMYNSGSKTISSCGLHSFLSTECYDIEFEDAERNLFVGSSHGWLVTIARKSPAIILINPATRAQIQLPPRYKFPDVTRFDKIEGEYTVWVARYHELTTLPSSYVHHHWLSKVVLSSNPVSCNNYMAACIYGEKCRLAFCKRGDTRWKSIHGTTCYDDIIFYKDRLYAFSSKMHMTIFYVSFTCPPRLIEIIEFPRDRYRTYYWSYLVEHCGDILLAIRLTRKDTETLRQVTQQFDVYKFNSNGSRSGWTELTDIEGGLLFLGRNASISVPSNHVPKGCRGNQIYFTDNLLDFIEEGVQGGDDIGVYDMINKTISKIEDYTCDRLVWPPPIWINFPDINS